MRLADKKDLTREQEDTAREALRQGQPRRAVVDGLVQDGIPKDTALRLTRRLRDQINTGS